MYFKLNLVPKNLLLTFTQATKCKKHTPIARKHLTKSLHSYSSNGAQINRPEDGEIAQSILENLEPWPTAWAELQPSEYLRADSYQNLLPHYGKRVEEFTVR